MKKSQIFGKKPVTFRPNAANVAKDGYWLTGESIGPRRTVLLSATMKLL